MPATFPPIRTTPGITLRVIFPILYKIIGQGEQTVVKNLLSILVTVIGIVCIVFGVMFIMQAGSSRTDVVDELKASNVTADNLNAKYDEAKAGLVQALTAGAPGAESAQSIGWQKASLGVAKSSLATISFVEKSGILTIVIGLGLVLTGLALMKKN
jgi:hypothetical protein